MQKNSIVEPGTRLRYIVKVINSTEVDGFVNIEDTIPEGTTLYNNVVSDNGKVEDIINANGEVEGKKIHTFSPVVEEYRHIANAKNMDSEVINTNEVEMAK